jgi:hypothetical protein
MVAPQDAGGRVIKDGRMMGTGPSARTDGELLQSIRELCMSFPQTQERVSHGEPAWFAGGRRMFLTLADHHHDNRVAFWAAAQDGVQRHLLEDEPTFFFRPPYVGARGWIGMWIDRHPDWDRVELLVDEAWRTVAGPRLVKANEAER